MFLYLRVIYLSAQAKVFCVPHLNTHGLVLSLSDKLVRSTYLQVTIPGDFSCHIDAAVRSLEPGSTIGGTGLTAIAWSIYNRLQCRLYGHTWMTEADMSFEYFKGGETFWIIISSSLAASYQRFGGIWCLHLQGTNGGRKLFLILVITYKITPCHNPENRSLRRQTCNMGMRDSVGKPFS